MEKEIKSYIESELKKLDNGEVKSVELEGVYPSVLESILVKFLEIYKTISLLLSGSVSTPQKSKCYCLIPKSFLSKISWHVAI